jgi:alkylhydroperoxidase/carboxymuconolactone decarboxylase family protein YurZ
MTKDIRTTLLWSDSNVSRGQWQTREATVLLNLNLLLLAHFRGELAGASESSLREAISLAIPATKYPEIKANLNVVLRKQ